MWEERTCSWCTWCAQQWGHKKPCRSGPGDPAPQHPRVSVRGAGSDPHASHALSPKPKQVGQRHSSALQLPMLGAFPGLHQAMAMFDGTSTRRSPSKTRAPSSARSTQDQDFGFLYTPLTLGLPLGFPGIEEVVMTDIYTHTHFSQPRNNHCRKDLVYF